MNPSLVDLLPCHTHIRMRHLMVLTHLMPWEIEDLVSRRVLPVPDGEGYHATWSLDDLQDALDGCTPRDLAARCRVVPTFTPRVWRGSFQRLADRVMGKGVSPVFHATFRYLQLNRLVSLPPRDTPPVVRDMAVDQLLHGTLLLGESQARPGLAKRVVTAFWFTSIHGREHTPSACEPEPLDGDPPPYHLTAQQVADWMGITRDALLERSRLGKFPDPDSRLRGRFYWHKKTLERLRQYAS